MPVNYKANIDMKIIRNSIIPFKGFCAINLFGVIFARHEAYLSETVLNHERIHTAQMKELGYVLFYVIYLIEWLVRLLLPGNAYRNISFEREAYNNQRNSFYLERRKSFAMWRK